MTRLRLAALGASVLSMAALAVAGPAGAAASPWLKAESAHFIIYTDTGEASAKTYDHMLEDFDSLLRTIYGRPLNEPAPHKLKVYLVGGQDDFHRVVPDMPKGIVGAYFASDQDTFVVSVRGSNGARGMFGDDTLLHEYSHHFMATNASTAFPGWYVEGFADYFSTADLGRKKISFGAISEGRADQLLYRPWISFDDVMSRNPLDVPTEEARSAYYAQAWLLTHYIMDSPARRTAFSKFIDLSRRGASPSSAWNAAFGETREQLLADMHNYMMAPIQVLSVDRTWPDAPVQISPISPGEAAVLLDRQLLRQMSKTVDKVALFKRLRDARAKFPDDAAVKATLAKAEIVYGDRDAGIAALREVVAADPKDVEALMTLARAILDASETDPAKMRAQRAEANTFYAQVLKIEPDNYQALYAYALNQRFEPGFPNVDTMNALVRAVNLAPQVAVMRVNAGSLALARREYDLARGLLEPVTGNPHEPGLAKAAKDMLGRIPAATPPGAAASPVRPGS